MTKDEQRLEIARARERADLARLKFGNVFNATLDRVSPDRLRRDAIEAATDQIEDSWHAFIRRFPSWPFIAAALGAAVAATMMWRPARVAVRHVARGLQLAWAMQQLWRQTNEREQRPG